MKCSLCNNSQHNKRTCPDRCKIINEEFQKVFDSYEPEHLKILKGYTKSPNPFLDTWDFGGQKFVMTDVCNWIKRKMKHGIPLLAIETALLRENSLLEAVGRYE